jgi:dipeptidyl aminopeptidase/acylaminoacyl peptidase
VLLEGSDPRYAASGHLLFTREAAVWAVAFDAESGRTEGDPVPVLEGVAIGGGDVARMTVASDGTLAYIAGGAGGRRTIVRVDRQGREEALPGLPPDYYDAIRLSPDATQLAFDAGRPRDVWTYDIARGTAARVTTDGSADSMPLWTLDGRRLVFASGRNQSPDLYWQSADGTGAAERFLSGGPPTVPIRPGRAEVPLPIRAETWANGGKTLLVTIGTGGGGADLAAIDLEGERRVRPLIATPSIEAAPSLSPDGQWLAYQSNLSGSFEVYVERFPGLGDRQKVSIGGGMGPRWARSGRELLYQSVDGRRVLSVPMSPGPKLTAGTPATLFEAQYVPPAPTVRPFELTPDGRFLLIKPEPVGDANAGPTVVVVQHWFEELRRLVPVKP